jgi:ferredoxin
MARLDEIQGDEGFSTLVKSLYGVSLEEAEKLNLATVIFKDESRCIQCGLCVKRCPTGTITMEEYHRESMLSRQETRGDELNKSISSMECHPEPDSGSPP